MYNTFNILCCGWMGFWAGLISLLFSFRSAARELDSEQHFRKCFDQSGTDIALAFAIRFVYVIPRSLFGDRIFSRRSIGVSVLLSVALFTFFLMIALLTTPLDPNLHTSVVWEYLRTIDLQDIYNHVSEEQNNNYHGIMSGFAIKLAITTSTTVVFGVLFEFICLSKSRLIMRQIRIDQGLIDFTFLFLFDLFSTIVLFILSYPIICTISEIALEIFTDMTYISPTMKTAAEKGRVLDFFDIVFIKFDLYSRLFIINLKIIVNSMFYEVKSGFTAFIMIHLPSDQYLLDSELTKELDILLPSAGDYRNALTQFLKLHPNFDVNKHLEHVSYSIFEFPMSLILSSAVTTTLWTTLVILTLSIARVICRISSRSRRLILRCCLHPHLIWNFGIRPSLIICLSGMIIITWHLASIARH